MSHRQAIGICFTAKSPKASLSCVVDPALCAASWRNLSPGQPPLLVIWTFCNFLQEGRMAKVELFRLRGYWHSVLIYASTTQLLLRA